MSTCPICGADVEIEREPAETYRSGMGGQHYPGYVGVGRADCKCRDAIEYGEDPDWTLDEYDEACIRMAD